MAENPQIKKSRTIKLLQSDPDSINRSQLNSSTSKMQYSMPKAKRFPEQKLESSNSKFYDIPNTNSQRSTSLGYGKKMDLSVEYFKKPSLCSIIQRVNLTKLIKKKEQQYRLADKSQKIIQHSKSLKTFLVQANTIQKMQYLEMIRTKLDILFRAEIQITRINGQILCPGLVIMKLQSCLTKIQNRVIREYQTSGVEDLVNSKENLSLNKQLNKKFLVLDNIQMRITIKKLPNFPQIKDIALVVAKDKES